MRFGVVLSLAILASGCTTPGPDAPTATSTAAPVSTTTGSPPTCATATPTATCGAPGPGPGNATPGETPPAQRPRFAGCAGSGPVTFAQSPMRDEDFRYLLPYGFLAGGHVTPIDHMYFEPVDRKLGRDVYEVRAIADGVIYTLQPRDAVNETGVPKGREWHVRFAHTCTFTSYFDLLTSLAPDLLATYNASLANGGDGVPPDGIPVKAGQLIGRIGAQTLDFGVYDYNVTLPGFLVPGHYSEEWKVHTVDPFPYFPPDARAALLAKMLRTAEPRAGKIDHDVDGRLIGNWFAVGTGGYGSGPDYWEGHFAFVPDALDPAHFFFSVGNWSGEPLQLAVKGNLDPANVSVETGLVEVELVEWIVTARNDPTRSGLGGPNPLRPGDDPVARNAASVRGVALLQMTGPRGLMLELFPGKTAAQVDGFTSAARAYER